jgi:hypothetical protein
MNAQRLNKEKGECAIIAVQRVLKPAFPEKNRQNAG